MAPTVFITVVVAPMDTVSLGEPLAVEIAAEYTVKRSIHVTVALARVTYRRRCASSSDTNLSILALIIHTAWFSLTTTETLEIIPIVDLIFNRRERRWRSNGWKVGSIQAAWVKASNFTVALVLNEEGNG